MPALQVADGTGNLRSGGNEPIIISGAEHTTQGDIGEHWMKVCHNNYTCCTLHCCILTEFLFLILTDSDDEDESESDDDWLMKVDSSSTTTEVSFSEVVIITGPSANALPLAISYETCRYFNMIAHPR